MVLIHYLALCLAASVIGRGAFAAPYPDVPVTSPVSFSTDLGKRAPFPSPTVTRQHARRQWTTPATPPGTSQTFSQPILPTATSTQLSPTGSPLEFKLYPTNMEQYMDQPIFVYIVGEDPNSGAPIFYDARPTPTGNPKVWYAPQAAEPSTISWVGDPIAIVMQPQSVVSNTPLTITLPGQMTSGRIYFATEPLLFGVQLVGGKTALVSPSFIAYGDYNYFIPVGIAEFTWNSGGLYIDVSYVDMIGLPVGMSDSTSTVPGLPPRAPSAACQKLKSYAATASSNGVTNATAWDAACVTNPSGSIHRVLSPQLLISNGNASFGGLYEAYVSKVWDTYGPSQSPLYIDTQNGLGVFACNVQTASVTVSWSSLPITSPMACSYQSSVTAGITDTTPVYKSGVTAITAADTVDTAYFAAPTDGDIFGCNSGPFANINYGQADALYKALIPRLCAGFTRSNLILQGQKGVVTPNFQPIDYASLWYDVTCATNLYSKVVHELEVSGIGYAFPYDDVAPGPVNEYPEPSAPAGVFQLPVSPMPVITLWAGGFVN